MSPWDELSGLIADLVRVNVRYVLEHRYKGEIVAAVGLPLPPQALTISRNAPALITHTLSGAVIRELPDPNLKTITLDGSAGYDARAAYDHKGGALFDTGPAILREFELFLEEYAHQAHEEPADYTDRANVARGIINAHELIFRAIDEDTHTRVEVESFLISKDAQSTHTAPAWSLSLKAYDKAPAYDRPFSDYQNGLDATNAAIGKAAAAVGQVGAALAGVNTLSRLLLGPLERLNHLSQAALSITEAARNILDIPSDALGRLSAAALNTRTSITRLAADVERFPATTGAAWQALEIAILGADEAQEQAERALARTGPPPPELTETQAPPLSYSAEQEQAATGAAAIPSAIYRLRLGEDLSHLARRIYGDASRWTELAELNGWLDAYHLPSGRPAQAGDALLIPTQLRAQPARTALGVDLLVKNGDLVLRGADLATISGPRNVEQALSHRIQTTRGELSHAPAYGLPRLTGRRLTANSSGYISAHISEQITQDPRIERLSRLELSSTGDGLALELETITSTGALNIITTQRGL